MAKSMEYQRYWKKKEIKSTHGQKGRSNQNQIEPEKMRTQKNLRKEGNSVKLPKIRAAKKLKRRQINSTCKRHTNF